MKEDLSLLGRFHHGLCKAVERDGTICFGKILAKGYCQKHYRRVYRHGSADYVDNSKRFKKGMIPHENVGPKRIHKKCIAPNCDKTFKDTTLTKGLCIKHYARWIKHGHYNIVLERGRPKNKDMKNESIQRTYTTKA